jgi:hypothetical protein
MSDTYVSAVSGDLILVQIGDGDDPEEFAHDCLINASRGLSLTANVSEQTIPNCTNPSLPDKTVRRVDSTDSTISGDGKLHSSSTLAWLNRVGKTINIKVRQAGVWQVAGAYILTEFSITGTAREFATASVSLSQADAPTITADVP